MNIIRVKLKEIQRSSYIIKSPFYSSVVINNFEIKTNEKLLISNINTRNDDKYLIKNCINFMNNFENFSIICCACNDPKNKVQLKKSLWFASVGLEMKDFLEHCYKDNEELLNEKKKIFEEVAKIECPVILKDKNAVLIESAIAPKKVINSAKRMRYFFNISEVHTCRKCHQKNKCKRFLQKYAGEPDFSDFARVFIGFYNICKAYIKRNETDRETLRHIVEKVQNFHCILFYMYSYMIRHKHFNYNNVEEGNKSIVLNYLKEKRKNMLLIKNQKAQEKILNIPKEYSEVLIPTEKAKMKKKQKTIFEKIQKFRRKSRILEDEQKFIWVEEKEDEDIHEENKGPEFDQLCNANFTENYNMAYNDNKEDSSLKEIKTENNPMLRFQYITKKYEHTTNDISIYNNLYRKYSDLLEKKVYINLDDQGIDDEIVKSENILFKIPEEVGGYTFINYIEKTPNNYIFPINENLYKGIQVYTREEINIGSFWRGIENEQLNIKKIDFFNPFNIKHKLDLMKKNNGRNTDKLSYKEENEEIVDLVNDISSFTEYIHTKQKGDKKKQQQKRSIKEFESIYQTQNIEEDNDDEDKRFEYFKKMRSGYSNVDQHKELMEEINTTFNSTYNDENTNDRNYTHTYNLIRKINEDKSDSNVVTLYDIEKEKKNLIENEKKELKCNSFYICKNIKFPELINKDNDIPKSKNGKDINLDFQKYLAPKTVKKNSKISELSEETIKANSTSVKGFKSLELFLKKKKYIQKKKNGHEEKI
ncbi:conserved Plasmodium protein, unknown function [Plasmodium berghei]|uniref:Uncharacterized protein n=2 Tax=Plasmodium berghei TaxID=5821 RepID=A0A509AV62_PLABA|nr:conserved Plasmodium protein, unknown function [Plasmodium berghei ANKA]CXJ23669.1 conserved Plasmodium protein, unknown function [Plasmodium berghei]SCM26749.1 conserved Plasmodium protein, unknown function [Plasmodium berghei]SCN28617.1 conserved Plasmodium protein, unknown function [Plasmodium berghei]SCO62811.1 conserved Plasmodium protein, unknown function [Plasmodium berghei]SCO64365.1 conserved Plasmodium protein, unknown function [Plasmodium berghei]|eukprot:XP_034424261.1 conserved Plasmodium protein, unknown function [Plasmodium berghei ANKA]